MQAMIQVKLPVEKAKKLHDRLRELKQAAITEKRKAEKAKRGARGADKEKAEAAFAFMSEVEKDIHISNLMRAIVDYAADNLLTAPDATLIALCHSARVHIGRPRTVEGKAVRNDG